MKKGALVVSLLALGGAGSAATFGSSARGTTTAQFLELGVGARAVAMGEAYAAVADDASALYWNPAGLTSIPRRSATLMHAAYVNSSYFDYASYAQRIGERAALGAGLQYFSAGTVAQTDAAGADLGNLSPYDLAASIGGAYSFREGGLPFLNGWSAGLSGKFIESRILRTARTEAVDAGALSPGYLGGRLRVALTMTNLGGTMKYEQASENLPLAFRLGGALKLDQRWLASADAGFPRDDRPFVALGTEYRFYDRGAWRLCGRAGFNSQTIGSVDGFSGVSLGFGLAVDGLAMDYAFVPIGGIGQAHRISLTYTF